MPKIVGLTGGIGSGKTLASDWFALQGICVIDADVVAREVVAANSPVLAEITQQFGVKALHANGTLNRTYMRELVFADAATRQQLERITHPAIYQSIDRQLTAAQSPYVILVSPLLLEGALKTKVDRVLLIDAPESLQISRATIRDNQPTANIQAIMQTQLTRAQRQELVDDVVVNNQSVAELYQKLQSLHLYYLRWSAQ